MAGGVVRSLCDLARLCFALGRECVRGGVFLVGVPRGGRCGSTVPALSGDGDDGNLLIVSHVCQEVERRRT